MGCPSLYYKKALQAFAHSLNYVGDHNKAREMFCEEDTNVLENEIMSHKNKLPDNRFYFDAGKASEYVLNASDKNDGCDGFNACLGGLYDFESWLELIDEDEE